MTMYQRFFINDDMMTHDSDDITSFTTVLCHVFHGACISILHS